MKARILVSLTLMLIAHLSYSQFPSFKPGSGQNMNLGHFYGKLLGKSGGKPLEGATLQLSQFKQDTVTKKRREVIISTILSDKKGEFSFENLSVMASYKLKISAIGYLNKEMKPSFDINMAAMKPGDFAGMLNNVEKDLGNIALEADTQHLENITITSSKPLLELTGDRKVYNVEKDLSTAGGTALDIMKNVPTLSVDADGNVSLRNAAPQIFVDGRPTTLVLDQIPADQVASVEIISNPSAKFDASGGGAGILNVVLKKNKRKGYNGNARASIDSRGRPGMGGDFNFRQNKINFSLSGMVGFRKTILTNTSERSDFLSPDTTAFLNQNNRPVGTGSFRYIRTGIDFLLDNRNTLTFNLNIGGGGFNNDDSIRLSFDTTGKSLRTGFRKTHTEAIYRNFGSGLSFKHNFARAGMEWTADANISINKNENLADFAMSMDNTTLQNILYNRSKGKGNTELYTLQTDLTVPFSKNQKIETGLRGAFRNFQNRADNYLKGSDGNYYMIPGFGTDYSFNDMVLAGYVNYSKQLKKISYQAGLRGERSKYEGNLLTTNRSFSNSFPLSLFPSGSISYKINTKQDVQLNVSRKINRPNFFQVTPFIDSSDVLNFSKGNPDLLPEFTYLTEMSYSLQYGKGQSLLATVYGKRSSNLITRYQYKDGDVNPNADSVLVITFGNAYHSQTIGLELTGKNKIGKRWDLTTNINLFDSRLEAGNLPGTSGSRQFSWFGKINNTFRLGSNFTLQVTADYQARALLPSSGGRSFGGGMFFGAGGVFGQNQPTAQGYALPFYGLDISIKKEFMKNNAASLTLQCTDVFRTRTYATRAESGFFSQDNERLRDPQILRLSFNWRFGKQDISLFKRKNLKGEMENMQNMQQMMN